MTRAKPGQGGGGGVVSSWFQQKTPFLFIQCNKNNGGENPLGGRNILTLWNVFLNGKLRKGRKDRFKKVKMGWGLLEHRHLLKCGRDLCIFSNFSVPKRHFSPRKHLFLPEEYRRVRYQVLRAWQEDITQRKCPSIPVHIQGHPSLHSQGHQDPRLSHHQVPSCRDMYGTEYSPTQHRNSAFLLLASHFGSLNRSVYFVIPLIWELCCALSLGTGTQAFLHPKAEGGQGLL